MSQLRQIAWHALDMDMLDGAEFAAERLLALDPSDAASKHLYGLILYRQRRFKAACNATNNTHHVGCAYIYAKSCLMLKNYSEGVQALEQTRDLWGQNRNSVQYADTDCSANRVVSPDYAAVSTLLGQLYERTKEWQRAIKSYGHATRSNPYLWESVEALCALRINLIVDNIFKSSTSAEMAPVDPFTANSTSTFTANGSSSSSGQSYLFKMSERVVQYGGRPQEDPLSTPPTTNGTGDYNTPTETKAPDTSIPVAPSKRISRSISTLVADPSSAKTFRRPVRNMVAAKRNGLSGLPRPGSQLFHSKTSTNNPVNPINPTNDPKRPPPASSPPSSDITSIYSTMTNGCLHFYAFRCRQAIDSFNSLPPKQVKTPYVLSKLGRSYFELVDYKEAESCFVKLRQLDRARIKDMEYYSTLLWHLRKEKELSFLARELISVNRESYQSWCALGNSFSLHKEPENALKCFQRAIYLDPSSPYPYTLQAHEYIASDALENAQASFRLAIRASNRHYNAWYGLGMVFVRFGDLEKAEYHFSHALSINPTNVVLICCLGMVLEKRGHLPEALDHYKRACEIQPKSALSRYKKVRAMVHLKLYDAALSEFDILKRLTPDEASVHFLLGQLYKVLDKRDLAVKHFTIALNLDPKGSHFIKDALEGITER